MEELEQQVRLGWSLDDVVLLDVFVCKENADGVELVLLQEIQVEWNAMMLETARRPIVRLAPKPVRTLDPENLVGLHVCIEVAIPGDELKYVRAQPATSMTHAQSRNASSHLVGGGLSAPPARRQREISFPQHNRKN